MPIKEPSAASKPDRGDYCDRALAALGRAARLGNDKNRQGRPGIMHSIQKGFMQASNWIERLGPGGEELSRDMRVVAHTADRISGQWKLSTDRIKYWKISEVDRRAAAAALHSGEGVKALSPDAKKAYDALEPTFASALRMAQQMDGMRQMPDGTFKPITGSGRPYPTMLSQFGRDRVAAAAAGAGEGDALEMAVRITMLNDPQVKPGLKTLSDEDLRHVVQVAMGHETETMSATAIQAGHAVRDRVEFGFNAMKQMHEDATRGVIPYFERTRVNLPDEMLELDPLKGLNAFFDRTALMLSSSRQWGWNQEKLTGLITRITKENSQGHANTVQDYIHGQLGKPVGYTLPAERPWVQGLQNYQMARLFGLSTIGPMRNFPQPITNTIDQPWSAVVKSLKTLPPFVHGYVKAGRKMHEMALRSGSVSAQNPTTEGLKGVVQTLAKPHTTVISENYYRSAVIGYYGLVENLGRVLKMEGERGPLTQAYEMIRHLSVDPQGGHIRALERAGLDPKRIDELRAKVNNATPAEKKAILEKPEDQLTQEEFLTGMQAVTKGGQFGLDFANKIIGRESSTFWRLATTVKSWGFRQGGYIADYAFTEARHGNFKPMVKLLGTTFILGELYNQARDVITGQEKSMLKRAKAGSLKNQDGSMDKSAVAWTTIRNIGDGGGLAMFMDVLYGMDSLIGGPVGGTFANMRRAQQHIVGDFDQTPQAVLDFLDKEFIFTNQFKGAYRRFKARMLDSEESKGYFEYHTWRDRAFKHEYDEDDPSLVEEAIATADRFLATPRNDPSPRSLTYEDAAAAISMSNVKRAAKHMARLLRTADDALDKVSILEGLATAGRSRSPLGPVGIDDRATFMEEFTLEQRQEGNARQAKWNQDWDAAVRLAQTNNSQRN